MRRQLVVTVCVVFVAATMLWLNETTTQAALADNGPVAEGRRTGAGDCYVVIKDILTADLASPSDELRASIDAACRVTVSRTRAPGRSSTSTSGARLARPLADSFRGCRTRNVMWDQWALAELTKLTTTIEFTYNGTQVNTFTRHDGSTYTAPGSPYTSNSTQWSFTVTVPNSQVSSHWTGDFYWWGSYDHEKDNYAYGYGNGQCSSSVSHVGNVCATCEVRFYLDYY